MKKCLSIFWILFLGFVYGQENTKQNNVNEFDAIANNQRAPMFRNLIAFDYDAGGNQIVRNFIYVASGIYKNNSDEENIVKELVKTDIYDDIKYYPNPVVSELFIQWKNYDSNYLTSIELFNINGQLVKIYNDLIGKEEFNVDFQGLPSGYYVMNLTYSNAEKRNLKIIKKEN